jgi:hypothetical protein
MKETKSTIQGAAHGKNGVKSETVMDSRLLRLQPGSAFMFYRF